MPLSSFRLLLLVPLFAWRFLHVATQPLQISILGLRSNNMPIGDLDRPKMHFVCFSLKGTRKYNVLKLLLVLIRALLHGVAPISAGKLQKPCHFRLKGVVLTDMKVIQNCRNLLHIPADAVRRAIATIKQHVRQRHKPK